MNLSLTQFILLNNEDPANFKGWTLKQFKKLINFRKKAIKK